MALRNIVYLQSVPVSVWTNAEVRDMSIANIAAEIIQLRNANKRLIAEVARLRKSIKKLKGT